MASCSEQGNTLPEERISFNKDWKFLRSDVVNGEVPELDDSAWRIPDLPHD